MDVNGCFYAKEEASIQEDIKVLEELKNKKYIVDKVEGWEQYLLTTRQQIAIENLIARNKELKKLSENIKMFRDNNLSSEIDYVIALKSNFMEYLKTDHIPKSKVSEKIEEANKEIKQMEQDDIGIGFILGNKWSDLKAKVKGWEELLQEGDK